jgi:hypothetical protein
MPIINDNLRSFIQRIKQEDICSLYVGSTSLACNGQVMADLLALAELGSRVVESRRLAMVAAGLAKASSAEVDEWLDRR